jgi:hypothetical protein
LVDLVAMNDTQTGRQILLRNGPWSFSASRHFAAYGAPGFVMDADGDGDSDLLVVDWWIPCLTFEPRRNGGLRRQYGAGSAGSGGITPALGATGPFRVGQSLNVLGRQGVGGAAAFLFVGGSETAAPVAGTPIIALVGPPQHFVLPLTLSGAAGVPGAGTLDLSMQIPASVSGLTIYLQLALGDAGAPVGITTSNGLELTFGF